MSSKIINKLKSSAKVVMGSAAFFVGLNIYTGNEKFYKNVMMPSIHILSPETAHEFAVFLCKHNLFPTAKYKDSDSLATTFFHHELTNPVGIAAGFDKQGEAVEGLSRIGFGFVEIGSVTPLPQPGNPKPRVFRIPSDNAIINRYGFNSLGHSSVYDNLRKTKDKPFDGVIGVNLGKNKTSPDPFADYSQGIRLFSPLVDYVVINVSSPNTPGLRSLQSKTELQNLLSNLLLVRAALPVENRKPILLKIAPDLTKEDVLDIVSTVLQAKYKVDGLIISNTTIDRSGLTNRDFMNEPGGLSGAPLRTKSTELIAHVYSLTKGKVPIIGVGGIFSGADAFEKIEAGASLVQLYTSFALCGPPVVSKIKSELSEILAQKGFGSVTEAVGSNYKSYIFTKK